MTLFTDIFSNSGGGAAYTPDVFIPRNTTGYTFAGNFGGSAVQWVGGLTTSYQTIFSYTGKGILQGLAMTEFLSLGAISTTKITIDGTAYIYSSTAGKELMLFAGVWKTEPGVFSFMLTGVESIPFETDIKVEALMDSAKSAIFIYKYVKVV